MKLCSCDAQDEAFLHVESCRRNLPMLSDPARRHWLRQCRRCWIGLRNRFFVAADVKRRIEAIKFAHLPRYLGGYNVFQTSWFVLNSFAASSSSARRSLIFFQSSKSNMINTHSNDTKQPIRIRCWANLTPGGSASSSALTISVDERDVRWAA